MPALENRTGFSALDFVSFAKDGSQRLVVCVAGTFSLASIDPKSRAPRPAEKQEPPALEDRYFGEPGKSSLRAEGQTAYIRPGTDVCVIGQAWSARGRASIATSVTVRVGPLCKQIAVIGDRVWRRGTLTGVEPSAPNPFSSMPLQYERAFGGQAPTADPSNGSAPPPLVEPRNPVGRGLYRSAREALDQPLPNLEDPRHLIRSVQDRPEPQGFGPIARSWMPRLNLAGRYDEAWKEQRAPLWPLDFDEQFFCAASAGMTARPHLRGGEPVELVGLSPDGPLQFTLPTARLLAIARFQDGEVRHPMLLDAVQLEPDDRRLTLVWRASIPVHRRLARHEVTTVRPLSAGEQEAA